MSKFLILAVISLFAFGAIAADGISAKTKNNNAAVIANLLASPKTPAEAKRILSAIVDGQDYDNRVSIMRVESDAALGRLSFVFTIGTDNLQDDDSGWGYIMNIEVEYSRNQIGDFYNLKSVKLVGLAG